MKHKVEGHDSLYKDIESGVIVNRQASDRARYQIAKSQALASIDNQHELSTLRREMDEIKSLLHQILNKP